MHIELVVPALFPAQEFPTGAMPALELLLARSRRAREQPATLEEWLCRAFALDGPCPAGALAALAHGLDAGKHAWLRADPVHLRADRDRVLLLPGAALSIAAGEAQELAAALAPLLAGKYALHLASPGEWCLQVQDPAEIEMDARPPIELAGQDIDAHLPPRQWQLLLTEIQMALYAHPVNTAREQRGDPAINSLWLWGAGRAPTSAGGPWQSISATDSTTLGLARSAGIRHRATGRSAREWLERAPEDGRHLQVLDGLRGARAAGDPAALERCLQELEADWFAPLLDALKSGRVGMLTIHAPEAAASFETVRGDLRRFWRRPRPLTSYMTEPA